MSGHQTRNWINSYFGTIERYVEIWPVDKTNRWIGFAQGVLFSNSLITIEEERDFTRPLFHEYYKRTGISIPESVKVE